jgi:PKD repeat protein
MILNHMVNDSRSGGKTKAAIRSRGLEQMSGSMYRIMGFIFAALLFAMPLASSVQSTQLNSLLVQHNGLQQKIVNLTAQAQHTATSTNSIDRNPMRATQHDNIPDLQKLRADPKKGSAPLTVTFVAHITLSDPKRVDDAGDYKIVFGDGSEYKFICNSQVGTCQGSHETQHTYSSNGSYEAALVYYNYFGPKNSEGKAPSNVIAKVEITVGEP